MKKTSYPAAPHEAVSDSSQHGSLSSYVIGIVLSLILTLASFGTVMTHIVPRGFGLAAIVVFGVVQLIVQLVFFLHLGASRDQRANTGIFVCTGVLIVVIVGLSLWVMRNANQNMMPTHMSVERTISRD